jgi:anti-sigma regulatory factor (Ser/Thr protein kinase)
MPTAEFGVDRASPREARAFVADVLSAHDVPEPVADVANLLVSELVTNAVLHARTGCIVTVDVDPGGAVRVAVHDRSRTAPRLRRPRSDAATGRGLVYVDRLANRWGTTLTNDGKAVWFELEPTATFGRVDRG